MDIALLQLNCQWMDAEANIDQASKLMAQAGHADLYILPEMWATGFCTSPTLSTDAESAAALQWMQTAAKETGAAIAGSLAIREWPHSETANTPALWKNRLYFVHPDGKTEYYDKQNLFTYGGEQLTYTPGRKRVIVEHQGMRFMLQTCFDLRFPESARNRASAPYDALIYVANWPEPRRLAWDCLLQARAIENQALCIGVNRTGTDPQCIYNGGSAAFDAYGNLLAQADEAEQAMLIQANWASQKQLRSKFRVLR